MFNLLSKKADHVPANSIDWGPYVWGELVNNLKEIEPLLEESRVISNDNKGNGMVAVILRGQKAVIPVRIKDFEMKPADEVMFKKDNQLTFDYLSTRTLLDLIPQNAIAKPSDYGNNPYAASDVAINMFSPAGGYNGFSGNQFSSSMSDIRAKSSSNFDSHQYAIAELKKEDFWKSASEISQKIEQLIEPVIKEEKPQFVLLHKMANNEYELYYQYGEKPASINQEQLVELLSKEASDVRKQKVAKLETQGVTILGADIPRLGNIFIENEDTQRYSMFEKPDAPPREGIFTINKIPVYVNPNLNYIDGTPSEYKLIVGKGEYSLSKTVKDFKALVAGESSELSKEEFLQTLDNKTNQPVYPNAGATCVIYDSFNYNMTMPFKILFKAKDDKGNMMFKVMPLFGDDKPTNITFYNGTTTEKVGPHDFMYPIQYTHMCVLPDEYNKTMLEKLRSKDTASLIRVNIWDQGGFYVLSENNRKMGPYNKGEFVFTLVNRYGFSETQASNLCDKLHIQKNLTFSVESILTEKAERPEINITPSMGMEKEAIDHIMKFAKRLSSINFSKLASKEDFEKDFNELDYAMNSYDQDPDDPINMKNLREIDLYKTAADVAQPQGPTNAEQRVNDNEQKMGVANNVKQFQNPQGNLINYLSNTTTVSKNTRDVIDYLLYLSVGKLRPEESVSLLNKVNKLLREVMNYLSKLNLLVKLERIPYINYTDIKTLLSDIDSFLSTLRTTTILMESN